MKSITITNPALYREARRYKDEASVYESLSKILVVLVGVFLAASIILMTQLVKYKNANAELHNEVNELQDTIIDLRSTINTMEFDSTELEGKVSTLTFQNTLMKDSISGMKRTIDSLDQSNAKLISDNKSLDEKLKKFEKRKELYNKYEYAIYDESSKRTDLTYEQIATGEELMRKEGIDPDLLFGIIMTESNGDEKATSSISTARGYGQFLAGSGKYVYEKVLKLGTYNHNMAYNGTTNITMAAGYLGYLKNERGFSAYKAVKSYRGVEPTAYIKRIDSFIGTKGNSFAKIASKW